VKHLEIHRHSLSFLNLTVLGQKFQSFCFFKDECFGYSKKYLTGELPLYNVFLFFFYNL
jgi:hypothetical protein